MQECGALPRELWCDEADSVDEVDSGWYDEVGYDDWLDGSDDWYDEVDSGWCDEVDSGSESSGHAESEEYSSSSGVQKASIKQACSVDNLSMMYEGWSAWV